jgi:hypothetical protein
MLALRLAQSAADRVSFDCASAVVEALESKNYTFEPSGVPGKYFESDDNQADLAKWLVRTTKVSWNEVREVLRAIDKLGLRIREPDVHPQTSDPRCTARAFENVVPFGAATAMAQKTDSSQLPPESGHRYK